MPFAILNSGIASLTEILLQNRSEDWQHAAARSRLPFIPSLHPTNYTTSVPRQAPVRRNWTTAVCRRLKLESPEDI